MTRSAPSQHTRTVKLGDIFCTIQYTYYPNIDAAEVVAVVPVRRESICSLLTAGWTPEKLNTAAVRAHREGGLQVASC